MNKWKLSVTATKWLKSFHIFFACCWGGSASSIFAIHCLFTPASGPELYARNIALIYIDNYVIFPSVIGCFMTGLAYSQFTRWGYVKHYWIISKWSMLLILSVAGILWFIPWLNKMVTLSTTIRRHIEIDPSYHTMMDIHTVMAAAQVAIIFFLIVISVLKPWGEARMK